MTLLFSYGSLLIPSITETVFNKTYTPKESVFLKGYKLILKKANSKTRPNYHFIQLVYTGVDTDLVPGFLIQIEEKFINEIDKWEGKIYKRESVICYTRELEQINCETYLVNHD